MKLDIIKHKVKKEKKVENQPVQNDSNLLNYTNVKNLLGNSEDIKYRDIVLNNDKNLTIHLVCIDGLVNSADISNYVIKPLIENSSIKEAKDLNEVITAIEDGNIYFATQETLTEMNKVADKIMNGACAILFDEQNIGFIFDTKGFDKRSMMEPTVENVNKGPRDSFIENYRTNTATVRRKIKDPGLTFEQSVIGQRTKTTLSIVYVNSIANDELVQMVRDRLNTINTDGVLSTSVIEDALSDDLKSTLPQVMTTERPDKFADDLLEGRVGVLVDGLPFGFIVPGTFNQFMQSPEDYSRKHIVSSFIRITRFISLIIAIFLPSLYVAIVTFHPEMVPTNIIMFIAKSREGVAFPVAVEAIGLLLAFEILYEAGLRIPKSVGQTVSIVGTLVVGQAAVEAKLVSPSIVVIIAATAIASFTIPNQDLANFVRMWRIVCTFFGIVFGLLGVVVSIIIIVYSMCILESFGVSYLSPFVANEGKGLLNDTFFRFPYTFIKNRPESLKTKDTKRVGD